MNLNDVINFNDADVKTKDLDKYLSYAADFFTIQGIFLFPLKKISNKTFDDKIRRGSKFVIRDFSDQIFMSDQKLRYEAQRFLHKYIKALKLIYKSRSISLESKLNMLNGFSMHLKSLSSFHNIDSRLSFVGKPFHIEVDGVLREVEFEYLSMSVRLRSRIVDLYILRRELFDELFSWTQNLIDQIRINQFENSKFKLESGNGHYIINEFILGLVCLGYIDEEPEKIEFLDYRLREIFGLPSEGRSATYYRNKIFEKSCPAKYLQKMVDAIEFKKKKVYDSARRKRPNK